jgi:hypothetical protein
LKKLYTDADFPQAVSIGEPRKLSRDGEQPILRHVVVPMMRLT